MSLEHYEYEASSDFKAYRFYSLGSNRRVEKRVIFAKMEDRDNTYNLGFGDLNPDTDEISDLAETRHGDMVYVLATVANIVFTFSEEYPDVDIYAIGSTHSRTRLYRICITKHFDEINKYFEVIGVLKGNEELFQVNVNYDGYLVKRRK